MGIEEYMRENDRQRKEKRDRRKAGVEDALKRAATLHKNDPNKGDAYLWATETVDMEGNERQYVVKEKIVEFVDGHAITADGRKIDVLDVNGVDLADDMDAQEIAVIEKKIEK